MIYLKISYFNTFDAFGLNPLHVYFMPSCLAWNIPEPKNARLFLWWVKFLTLYKVGIYHYFHLLELELYRDSTVGLHFCCTCVSVLVLLLSTLSIESWFLRCCFDSLMRRSPSREPSNLYVYEAKQNLGWGLLQCETGLSPSNLSLTVPRRCFSCGLF